MRVRSSKTDLTEARSRKARGDMTNISSDEKDPILARIARLETENRRLKQGALILLVGIASIGLMGQTTQRKVTRPPAPAPPPPPLVLPKNIEAESFILKDPSGKARAELSMSGTGPSLKLLDQGGSALVTISLNDTAPGGPFVLLSDPQHRSGLSMSVLEGAGSQLSLTSDNTAQVHFGVAPDGTSFELTDRDGFATSIGNGMQPTKGGQVKKTSAAAIALYNKDRKVLWSTP